MADLRTDDRSASSPEDGDESSVELAVEAVEAVIAERRQLWRREYTALLLVAFVLAGFATRSTCWTLIRRACAATGTSASS